MSIILTRRRDGRAVECTGLENRQGLIALPGFESLSLRQNIKGISYLAGSLFSFLEGESAQKYNVYNGYRYTARGRPARVGD